MSTYQSKYPVKAWIIDREKQPNGKAPTQWEIDHGYEELMIEGARGSFMHLYKCTTNMEDKSSTGKFGSTFIIPITDATKDVRELLKGVQSRAAQAIGVSMSDVEYPKIKEAPLGATRKKFNSATQQLEDVIDKETGLPKLVSNDGHLSVVTNNNGTPPNYYTVDGKLIKPKKLDTPVDTFTLFEDPIDPVVGKKASEVLAAGNNVRVKVKLHAKLSAKTGKPQVWIELVAIQFLAEDEQFGAAPSETDDSGLFGAVNAPSAMESAPAEEDDDLFD